MKKSIINNIKKMLDSYNELIERIHILNAENQKLGNAITNLETLEPCDNVDTAIKALKAEYKLNNDFIVDYLSQVNEYDERIENAYDENRDYKNELRQDVMNTFKTMIDNATSDYANEWLIKRMTQLDGVTSNYEAFALMVNLELGTL